MRDWQLPRVLVRYLQALHEADPGARGRLVPVQEHLDGLSHRLYRLVQVARSHEQADELSQAAAESVQTYARLLEQERPDLEAIIGAASRVQAVAQTLRDFVQELPRVTGSGPLDELFHLGSHLLEGKEVPQDALMAAVVGGRQVIGALERRQAAFSSRFPGEPEIVRHLEESLQYLRQGLGGVYLFLLEEASASELGVALKALVRGGNGAVSGMAAMDQVVSDNQQYSKDPVLEALFQAFHQGQDLEPALMALEDAQEALSQEIAGLERTFAPHNWRTHHLGQLHQTFKRMEGARDALIAAFESDSVKLEHLQAFQNEAIEFDRAEEEARNSLPTREQLPNVANLVGLIELMGAVFEERAPLFLLAPEVRDVNESFRDYGRHLERLYQAQKDATEEFDDLLCAVEDMGEALALVERGLTEKDPSVFPQAYEWLLSPLQVMDRYTQQFSGQAGSVVARETLPPFFEELKVLFEDRAHGMTSEAEFQRALAAAENKTTGLMAQLKAPLEAGSAEARALGEQASQLAQLFQRARTSVGPGEIREIERLGQAWGEHLRQFDKESS